MSGTADQTDHVPSTGTSNNRTAEYLENTAGGVRLSISAFPGRFQRVWHSEAKRCHVVESLFRASVRIMAVFRAVLSSNASIAFDTVP